MPRIHVGLPQNRATRLRTLRFTYIPRASCVELKSLKLYLQQFRQEGIFYADVTNRILDDLVSILQPQWMRLEAIFTPRGGIRSRITAEHGKAPPENAPVARPASPERHRPRLGVTAPSASAGPRFTSHSFALITERSHVPQAHGPVERFGDESAQSKGAELQFAAFAAIGLQYYSLRFIDAGEGSRTPCC